MNIRRPGFYLMQGKLGILYAEVGGTKSSHPFTFVSLEPTGVVHSEQLQYEPLYMGTGWNDLILESRHSHTSAPLQEIVEGFVEHIEDLVSEGHADVGNIRPFVVYSPRYDNQSVRLAEVPFDNLCKEWVLATASKGIDIIAVCDKIEEVEESEIRTMLVALKLQATSYKVYQVGDANARVLAMVRKNYNLIKV